MSDNGKTVVGTPSPEEPEDGVKAEGAGPGGPASLGLPAEDWVVEGEGSPTEGPGGPDRWPALTGRRRGRALARKEEGAEPKLTRDVDTSRAEVRLLILDMWRQVGIPAEDFLAMLGPRISRYTLYAWKKRFDEEGPAGLVDRPREGRKDGLSEVSRRAIVSMKKQHPEWGVQRISDSLLRGPGLSASATTVAKVLHESGYESVEEPTHPHAEEPKRFERAKPNQLWQSDIFQFWLRRQNRQVYFVAFLDDHSRFIVTYGLHATNSAAFVIESVRAGIGHYGPPEEVLTDNGTQYHTWRGKSAFTKDLERNGVKHILGRPRHPQTTGKIERFWGTLWSECLERAVFIDLEDARKRIGLFIDHYNFQRPHQGIEGLVPADRFFGAASDVKATLAARVAANALELARHGVPAKPFYVTGQVGGKAFSVHAEGERVIMTQDGKGREEVELVAPDGPREELPSPVCPQGVVPVSPGDPVNLPPRAPGESPLDAALKRLNEAADSEGGAK